MGYIEMIMDISRLLFIDFIVDVASFKVSVFASLIFTANGAVCYGVGYENEQIGMNLTL